MRLLVAMCAAVAAASCTGHIARIERLDGPPCAGARVGLAWYGPARPDDRAHLSRGCEAVGAPAVVSPADLPDPPDLSDLSITTWNMHEGRGDLGGLIETLSPPFVLLIQEAVSAVTHVAESHGLSAAYVPSMPNGRGKGDGYADRGNAIVSTLPLDELSAIELPWVYQRRVAVMATIAGTHFVSVHLDNRPGRKQQAEALAQFLETIDSSPVIVGGDFNTWFGEREDTVAVIDAVVPLARGCGDTPTFRFGRHLDYIFTRVGSADPRCQVLQNTFGSDHHPVGLDLRARRTLN